MPATNPNDAHPFPWGRLALSAVLLSVLSWLDFGIDMGSTIATGRVAGMQFNPSDVDYISTMSVFRFLHGASGMANLWAMILLIILWFGPVKRWLAMMILTLAFGAGLPATPASAYYEDSDWNESYFILPNESAFFLPDVGDNKSTQSQFGSEAYLRDNKIAAKRFTIPHVKLPSSGWFSNKYVPAGRLIIVDRTPFSREWVKGSGRGTSARDESFPCQSKEGLDISVGMSIGTSVAEDMAAKFLYRFGIKVPGGDRTQPQVIFQSVFYGRGLSEVMDGPVRNKVQSLVCSQFTSHNFDEDNATSPAILKAVETDVKAYLDGVGITLDYIGWADTFEFERTVQDAVNRRYIASKDKEIAELLGPYASTIQGLALAEAIRNKWDGKVPSSVSLWWLPSALTDLVSGMVKVPAPVHP